MKKLLYGCAYYDEYMPEERLALDMRMMHEAGMNLIRIAESTWASEEPREGEFDFSHVCRAIEAAKAAFEAGTLHVFDTAKAGFITKDGEPITSCEADVDTDPYYASDTEVVFDGYFHESEFRSAPYFDVIIDGIEMLNSMF